ncbi:MAG: hypothetical protein QOF45_2192 [Gaiellaceae bacterium]|jgi:ornithine cyclodeaminase/alanine dehydrogenase|nr:hypothetical protein [Gaiellaceae bacterium]
MSVEYDVIFYSGMSDSLLYLTRDAVRSLLPSPEEQLEITAGTYVALAAGTVEMPPKPAIHPREHSFLHAMPAYLADADVAAVKWVGGSASNKARGLPYISGLIVVNDPETGRPLAIMDASEITAARTAAASGVCIRRFAGERWERVALIGFGEQGRAHARLLEAMNPDASLAVYNRSAPDTTGLNGRLTIVDSPQEAVAGATIVVTAIPLEKAPAPIFDAGSLADAELLLPLDFDASLEAGLVSEADLFVVDDVGQFEHYRNLGHFEGWPPADTSIGAALATERRPARTVCCNLGIAALDAAFAAHVLDRARESRVGLELPW